MSAAHLPTPLPIHRSNNRQVLARWKQIYRHADWLGLDFIRVEVEQRMYQPALEIKPIGQVKLKAGAGAFTDELPPSSLTIFSTYRLDHSDRGVTVE